MTVFDSGIDHLPSPRALQPQREPRVPRFAYSDYTRHHHILLPLPDPAVHDDHQSAC